MAPKFRGSSEDWLDNEGASHRSGNAERSSARKGRRGKGQAQGLLEPSEANATVAEVFHKQCEVLLDEDRSRVLCPYRRAMVYGSTAENEQVRERSPVAVGDRVVVKCFTAEDGVIEGVCRRSNFLSRPAPGRTEELDGSIVRHVVAANMDILVIVASVEEPSFAPGLVDRFLIAAASAGISPLICISKVDLLKGTSPSGMYRELGYEVFDVSAKTHRGIEELSLRLKGKIAAFCGHSGVGKTSLLSALLGKDIGKVAKVSSVTGKGKHTTSSAVLLDNGWIDTPGVREFGLLGVAPERLRHLFPEFTGKRCGDPDCWHRDEEGCQVRDLPRHGSYRRILESLIAGEN